MSIYGLIIGVAFWVGIYYFQKHNKVIPKNRENIFILGIVLFSIVGARIYHVLDYWDYYSHNTLKFINTGGGGRGIYGGIIGGVVFAILFALINRLSILKIINTITPVLPFCQAIGRWGNFANHEVYSPTGQPVWLYESILNLGLFFLIKLKAKKIYQPTAIYLIGYGFIRFFLEFLRNDTWQLGQLKVAQIISVLLIIIGIILLRWRKDGGEIQK